MLNTNEIRDILRKDVATVTFTKKNGETREMICTLLEQYLPEVNGNSVFNDEIVTVWDLEKGAWRSFRTDSVISLQTDDIYVME